MNVRKLFTVIVLAGCVATAFATKSRVLTMGRSDDFFMDDVSIFRNPANINVYPNMLLGSLGYYTQDAKLDSSDSYAALYRYNRDPQQPYFGGIMSYSLNQSTDAGDQYPMLSMGAVFNRHDDLLDYVVPGNKNYLGSENSVMKDPLGKIDILLGYALKNGAMIGIGTYMAFQKFTDSNLDDPDYETSLYRWLAGINWPIAKTMNLEVSVAGGLLNGVGQTPTVDASSITEGISPDTTWTREVVADGDFHFRGDVRLFSAMTSLNGDIVPHLGAEIKNFGAGTEHIAEGNIGLGINLNIDRGFFWGGAEGIYQDFEINDSSYIRAGGKVSFGIERNIVWDWLVWRVGVNKLLLYQRTLNKNGITSGHWVQNPEADASDRDHVGFGIALNIENRLKVDGVLAEDVFYTFTNLLSGNQHHIFTRIDVTYSF